jgi:ribosome-associated protein
MIATPLHPAPPMEDPDFEPNDRDTSKTQRKKEMTALQQMGAELVKLPRARLERFDLPEPLFDALLEAQRITSHGAIRRQMQYIGKLMRDADAELIAAELAAIRGESDTAKAQFHALERWRDRLLAQDDALTEWLGHHPGADAQQMRQLIRNARREAVEGKPPRSSRALFRLLRDSSDHDPVE